MGISQSAVHRIPDMGFSNAYLVELDSQRLAVIDTGTPGKEKKILNFVESLGRKPADISYIILTHPDSDHSGSAAALKRLTGATLAIGEVDAPRLSGEKKLKETSGLSGIMLGVFGLVMRVERIKADLELKDGSTVDALTIVATPGHTDGSISVYLPGTAIFVGDLLRTDGSGKLKLASPNMSRDMEEVKRSVEKISKLEFQQLLPGHGAPIQESASNALRSFVANKFQ
ncbi:MAG: MBL fold metallo-hydrolase [Nitrososphaerota archaeon]|nr:MBL fold metallo-hydrolase [Nitrososphaerota archaeon]